VSLEWVTGKGLWSARTRLTVVEQCGGVKIWSGGHECQASVEWTVGQSVWYGHEKR
jgi:hypothetical protein